MQKNPDLRQIFRLSPDNFTSNIWGGRWLPRWKKIKNWQQKGPVGESWEFSGHPKHPSFLLSSMEEKVSLRDFAKTRGKSLFGKKFGFGAPFLLKFIDACDHLSLQVHPSMTFAKRHEKDSGKSESWLILHSSVGQDEGFIYVGFRPRVNKSLFKRRLLEANALGPSRNPVVRKKAAAMILPFLNRIHVKAGNCYHIPPGTPHIIGKGVRLFEIQLTSDLTYRVWDWNRPDPERLKAGVMAFRPLHFKKALAVTYFHPHPPAYYFSRVNVLHSNNKDGWRERCLLKEKNKKYALNDIWLYKKGRFYEEKLHKNFRVLTLLQGKVRLHEGLSEPKTRQPAFVLKSGQSAFIPATLQSYRIEPLESPARVLKSYLP